MTVLTTIIKEKEVMNLKTNMEGYVGGVGKRKGKENEVIMFNLKNKNLNVAVF